MRKQNTFALTIAALFVAGLFFYFGKEQVSVAENPQKKEVQAIVVAQEQSETLRSHSGKKDIKAQRTSKLPARAVYSISSSEVKSLRGTFPEQADVKKEVGTNPHQTPESLIKFAKALGPLMEKALRNKDDASLLLRELQDCALDKKVAHTARALCVSNAEKMGNAHSEMRAKAEDLRTNVSPEVKELLNKKNMLLKK